MRSKTPTSPASTETVRTSSKPYDKPVLKTYGLVRDLTQGGTGAEIEGGSGMIGMM